jgi:estrogen-related receptor beta like 1
MGDGMEVADPQNMPDEMYDDDEEEAYLDIRGGGATATVDSKAKEATEQDESVAVIEARVDPAEWKLELERVGPKLKITLAADTKDWRSHLEQAHSHKKEIEQLLPESKVHLDKVNAEVTAELEKVGTRERFLNNQFDALIMEYRLVRERLGEVQERYGKSSEAISELTNELGRVTEELEEVKRVLEERGSNISDTSPVVKIKEAINLLQVHLPPQHHDTLRLPFSLRRQLRTHPLSPVNA